MADRMQVAEMMKPNGRVFLKSEWGQISSDWPCVSFTKRSVGERLRRDFLAGRDVLIYVGTTDPEMTELPEHRSRLISAVAIEPIIFSRHARSFPLMYGLVHLQNGATAGHTRWPSWTLQT